MNRIGVYTKNGAQKYMIGQNVLWRPRGIAKTRDNLLVIADSGNDQVIIMNIHGSITKRICNLHAPNDVSVFAGVIYITEWYKKTVRAFKNNVLLRPVKSKIKSGNFSMLLACRRGIYVADDSGILHHFVFQENR